MSGKVSAGLVLWHGDEVLIARMGGPFWARRDRAWTIPKGEPLPDEDLLTCARREWAEETGWAPPSGPYESLGSVTQRGGKTVHAWSVEGDVDATTLKPGTFLLQGKEIPEISEARWVSRAEAAQLVVAAQAEFFDRLP